MHGAAQRVREIAKSLLDALEDLRALGIVGDGADGRAREDELSYLDALRNARHPAHGDQALAETGREVWFWLADPAHRSLLALWTEGYARSLQSEPGPWAEFARDTVSDWLDLLAARQPPGKAGPDARAERTLLLAVLRGALLDLLATGDHDRVTAAVERHLRALGG